MAVHVLGGAGLGLGSGLSEAAAAAEAILSQRSERHRSCARRRKGPRLAGTLTSSRVEALGPNRSLWARGHRLLDRSPNSSRPRSQPAAGALRRKPRGR